MKRTTRASFSGNPPVIDVRLPQAWHELSHAELLSVYRIIVRSHSSGNESVEFSLFRYFTGLKVLSEENGYFRCRFIADHAGKTKRVLCRVTPMQLAELLEPLSFIYDPGTVPVRIDSWHGAKAVDAQFHGVTFGEYLQIENLYQGYLSSHNDDALISVATILYPGIKNKHIDEVFLFGILRWLIQVKALFSRNWPNFFKPATGGVSVPSMLDVMNNEIRALTGGDVTKEEVIFSTDCWRALTELDFKAKEAEEYKRQMSKHK